MVPKTVSSPPNVGVIGELRERSQIAGDSSASYDLAVRFHKGVGVAVNFGGSNSFISISCRTR